MEFVVAERPSPHGLLLVITDKDVLGKMFEEGRVQLDLRKEFYQGEIKEKEEVKKLMLKSRHLHLTGKGVVALGIELGLVQRGRILLVQGTPHAQVVMGG